MPRAELVLSIGLIVLFILAVGWGIVFHSHSSQRGNLPTVLQFATHAITTPSPGVFYVSPEGDDYAAGSRTAPWRHIQYALDRAQPGDTVYVLNGVYHELISFHHSGSAEAGFITLQNAPGHTPVLDGSGLALPGEPGLAVIENQSYIKIIGFELRNLHANGDGNVLPAGIWVRGYGSHIELRDNRVHDITNRGKESGAHGIAVYGRDPIYSIHDIVIDGNEVFDNQLGFSEALVLNGNVEKFVISNNKVHDNDNIGIDLIGFEGTAPDPAVDRARHGLVSGNLVYNISSYQNPAYGEERSADGIYVDGGVDIVIERNLVHHANIGIELASEHKDKNTSHIVVRNNIVHSSSQAGLAIGGYDEQRGITEDCVIVNNTFFDNATQGDWGAELYIQFDTRRNVIKNNIFYAGAGRRFIESWSPVMEANLIDTNLYFALGGGSNGSWIWKNVPYTTFASYQKASANDTHSLAGADPLFTNTQEADLHLRAGSPAIDRGEALTASGALDFDGQPRAQGAAPDLGAIEHR